MKSLLSEVSKKLTEDQQKVAEIIDITKFFKHYQKTTKRITKSLDGIPPPSSFNLKCSCLVIHIVFRLFDIFLFEWIGFWSGEVRGIWYGTEFLLF